MSTSGSYDNVSTAADIIKDAFALINAHDPAEPLPGEKVAHGRRVLNQVVNFMSIREGLWLRTSVSHTLTPGTASYTIGTGQTINTPLPMRIIDARKTVSSQDIPIGICSRDEYLGIPNKTLQAGPLMVYYNRLTSTGTLYVWPTGTTSDKTLTITTSRPIQDFDIQGNNPDLPREWVLFLTYLLAEALAPTYCGGNIPQGVSSKKDEMLVALLNFDAETTSIFVQP